MAQSMDRLLEMLRQDIAAAGGNNADPRRGTTTGLLANIGALHAKELQDLTFEVSLYKKEALRLKNENDELRQELLLTKEQHKQQQHRVVHSASPSTSTMTTTSTTSGSSDSTIHNNTKDKLTTLVTGGMQAKIVRSKYGVPPHIPENMTTPTKTISTDDLSQSSSRVSSPTDSPREHHRNSSVINSTSPATAELETLLESNDHVVTVPLAPPFPNHFPGHAATALSLQVPSFKAIMNYPATPSSETEGHQRCTMCGHQRLLGAKPGDGSPFVPKQNKGVCTACDVKVWIMPTGNDEASSSSLYLKWCKGCKNFQHWASFGEKGWATKCAPCRKRMADKYAAKKLEASSSSSPHHHANKRPRVTMGSLLEASSLAMSSPTFMRPW